MPWRYVCVSVPHGRMFVCLPVCVCKRASWRSVCVRVALVRHACVWLRYGMRACGSCEACVLVAHVRHAYVSVHVLMGCLHAPSAKGCLYVHLSIHQRCYVCKHVARERDRERERSRAAAALVSI